MGLLAFNLVIVLLCAVTIAGRMPPRLYGGFLRMLHNTIGITAPTDQQVRAVLVVWLISVLVIVDALALLFTYVF